VKLSRESASIFSQNSDIFSTEQNSTIYTTKFLQHFREVSDHINRSVYLSLRSNQVSKFYHNSSDISSQLNGIDYLVASQQSFTPLKD